MIISGTNLTIIILSTVLALLGMYLVGKWAFTKDQEFEDKVQRPAMHISRVLSAMGLIRLPKIMECVAIKDFSGLYQEIRDFSKLLIGGEAAVVAEFDQVFKNVLTKKLALPDGRAMVAALLADATKPTDPSITRAVTAEAVAA